MRLKDLKGKWVIGKRGGRLFREIKYFVNNLIVNLIVNLYRGLLGQKKLLRDHKKEYFLKSEPNQSSHLGRVRMRMRKYLELGQ